MDIALINAVPFVLALVFASKSLIRLLPHASRAWLAAGGMALLFVGLLSYLPELQSLDAVYKEPTRIEEQLESSRLLTEAERAVLEGDLVAAEAAAPEHNAIIREIEWVPELGLSFSLYLDGLSMIFALVITGIGSLIFLYAGYYFEDDDDQIRFLMTFFAFAGAMLGVVLAGNLMTMFIMWELTSITSFLLIGFKGGKSGDARFASLQALLITSAGALALLVGVVLIAALTGDLTGQGMTFELTDILLLDARAVAEHPLYAVALVLVMLGAFTKSAQFPFHFWLPGAMSAPTPASAYLHSATMVKAGIYLLLRLQPPMHASDLWMLGLIVFGGITMFIGALFALTKRDLKGLLAYATVSKLGAIVLLIGIGGDEGIKAALIGILAHALYKSALFLITGTIDHNTGTRIIEKLGGLREYMPIETGIALISGLSMAGFPFLLGFLAKEELILASLELGLSSPVVWVVVAAATLTVTGAFIYIWDVFFAPPLEIVHYHRSPIWLSLAPAVLAACTFGFAIFVNQTISPLITPATHEVSISLPVLPYLNLAFLLSVGAIAAGWGLFQMRGFWLQYIHRLRLPTGNAIYQSILNGVDALGTQALRLQSGQVRYYLVWILGTVAVVLLTAGQLDDFVRSLRAIQPDINLELDGTVVLRVVLIIGAIIAALTSVLVRQHTTAALVLGVFGYAIGAIILIEPAPDVSMVQFLVETLATVLIIIMLGRISSKHRGEVQARLWKGRSMFRNINLGIFRDLAIAIAVGFAVFIFALTALVNRPDRDTIADQYLQNAYPVLEIEDVVGAVVTDFRAMDTYVEIVVFAVAALGVFTLITRGYTSDSPFAPNTKDVVGQGEFEEDILSDLEKDVKDNRAMETPFTALVTRYVLPLSFLVGISHIVNGSSAPGDGFTAGVLLGLATSLWYVVFGYQEAEERLTWFNPSRLMRAGLFIALINGGLAIWFNSGFLGHVDYGSLLGIKGVLDALALKFNTTIVFEIAIFFTVFGSIGIITEAIAHPTTTGINLGDDEKQAAQTDQPEPQSAASGGVSGQE